MAQAKNIGSGWHFQPVRHSNARKFGCADGKQSRKYYQLQARYDARSSFYGKAKVENENGNQVLYSYNTKVAEITPNGRAKVYGNYSQTTNRHIKEFLKQNGFKAENTKQIQKDYNAEQPRKMGKTNKIRWDESYPSWDGRSQEWKGEDDNIKYSIELFSDKGDYTAIKLLKSNGKGWLKTWDVKEEKEFSSKKEAIEFALKMKKEGF